jgi:ParB/RepB/Spo0J family partition protein
MRFRDWFVQLKPEEIKVESGFNVRDYSLPENLEHLQNLTASIKAQGVLQALWVRLDAADNKYYLVDGECRLKATLEANKQGAMIKQVPCKLVEGNNEVERKLQSLTANSGKPLSKWEAGQGYKQLKGWGLTEEDIAVKVAQSPRYVREAIELAGAPQAVKALLSEGKVTPRAALLETREHGTKAGKILAEKVAVAEASGTGVVKAERKTKEEDFIKITRALYNDCQAEYVDNEANFDTEDWYEHVPVRAELLRKLFKLIDIEAARGTRSVRVKEQPAIK